MTDTPNYRRLPEYIPTGAKRDVWQFFVDDALTSQTDWSYFRLKSLSSRLKESYGRTYHQVTISRALSALNNEGYIDYRPGNRGQSSSARLVPDDGEKGE